MQSFFFIVIGFALLIIGADKFVAGASALASRLGLPTLLIGLTVVAFGTSAPELAVSVTAGLQGANEIALGNVLGSNLFNLLAIAGLSAIIHPLVVDRQLLQRDWLLSALAVAILGFLMCLGDGLSRLDGFILLACFVAVLSFQIIVAMRNRNRTDEDMTTKLSLMSTALHIIGGLIAIIIGGQITVDGAVGLAQLAGLSETSIGLTIVAIGTSLPELVTSVVATRRGEHSIAMGNIIGSNIFNILFILGTSVALSPISVQPTAIMDCMILFTATLVLYLPALLHRFGRITGTAALLGYMAYTIFILIR